MDPTKHGPCILCQEWKQLCDSHIVPEFCHAPIYDEKHRAYAFSPVAPERARVIQKGIRSRLLCAVCEGKINDWYEKPFRQFWFDGDALSAMYYTDRMILRSVPYKAFKLFHLSVLLRAAESDHPNFSEISLGGQLEEVRRMVRNRDAGSDSRYQIICIPIERPDGSIWHDLVAPAHPVFIGDVRAFYFTFAGAQWI